MAEISITQLAALVEHATVTVDVRVDGHVVSAKVERVDLGSFTASWLDDDNRDQVGLFSVHDIESYETDEEE